MRSACSPSLSIERLCSLRQRRGDLSLEVIALTSRLNDVALPALLGCAIFILAGTLAIGHSIARPVRMLQRGAMRIGAGDWNTPIALDRRDEFGELAVRPEPDGGGPEDTADGARSGDRGARRTRRTRPKRPTGPRASSSPT